MMGAAKLPPEQFIEVIEKTPLVSVDLVFRDEGGRVLVGRRANEPARGCWFVPGGRVCKDERIAEAFRRLSAEEIGQAMEIDQGRFLGVYEHLYETNFAGKEGVTTHYVTLGFEVPLGAGAEITLDDQHSDVAWMTPEQLLASPEVHENTKAYFRPYPWPRAER
jgi:colanic acid biosynthesis protein WcaH